MKQNATFHQRYRGPRGPHLANLTSTSLFGHYDPSAQRSIHPGVIDGRRAFPVSHTKKWKG